MNTPSQPPSDHAQPPSEPNTTATPIAVAPSRKPSRHWGPWWLRWPLKALLGLLSLAFTLGLLIALALFIWGGQEGSLPNTLQGLQKLGLLSRVQGASGSLARGGQVQALEAQFGGTQIQLRQVQAHWQAQDLWRGQLHIQRLAAGDLRIRLHPSTQPSEPTQAPSSLSLPLTIALDTLAVEHIALYTSPEATEPSWQASGLRANYQYQAGQHRARISALQMYGGQYQAQAVLAGKRPFALQAAAQALLPVPGLSTAPPLTAQLQLGGNLLDIQAQLEAQTQTAAQGAAPKQKSSSANMNARIQPWGTLLQAVDGELSNINLAVFAPDLPQTQISGKLIPDLTELSSHTGENSLHIDLRNSAAQPWDKGGLPVDRAQGQLRWSAGQISLPKLTLQAGAGSLELQGQWQSPKAEKTETTKTAHASWQAQAQLHQLDLALLYSAFASSSLQGQIQAEQAAAKGELAAPIHFSVDATNQTPAQQALHLLDVRQAKVKGSWQAGALDLPEITLQTSDAKAEGRLQYQQQAQHAQADLQLQAPGLNGQVQGHISPKNGQGELALNLQNAEVFSSWLGRWPGMSMPSISGQAQLQAAWQGGWTAPQLQAQLQVPQLQIASAEKIQEKSGNQAVDTAQAATKDAANFILRKWQIQANGSLRDLRLSLQGDWQQAQLQGRAELEATAGVQTEKDLRLQLQTSRTLLQMSSAPTPLAAGWQLEQASPIALQWQSGHAQLAAGKLRLTAPQALKVGAQRSLLLEWQNSELQQGKNGGIASARSSGQLLGLSHTWLEALSGASLAQMGLAGQILLDARWDLRLDERLRLEASLARSSGDFYLQSSAGTQRRSSASTLASAAPSDKASASSTATPNTAPNTTPARSTQSAGLRDVYLKISGNDEQLRLQALWDSSHAGRVQADLSSRISRENGSWTWPESSPVQGKLEADLPTLGLWSALAPTGWRVAGKMAVNAQVAGTRAAPDLQGSLRLQDLAMRSVLDGVELQNGQLLAKLHGTRMDLEQLRIEGAQGSLNGKGYVAWAGGLPSMDIDLQADKLRASNRPDRRVTVSGKVHAGIQGQRIALQGELGIDDALILLADSSKPALGSDVRIVRRQQQEQGATTVPSEAQLAAEEAAVQAAATQALAPFAAAAGAEKSNPWTLDAAVALDMGKNFRIRGLGLDTQLAGTLLLHAVSQQNTSKGKMALRPEVTGILRTVGGEYRAYGQWLEIEEGLIRFTGPYNDPQLDILAIRPRTEERVGVRITGPASNPRAALYAESAMPDAEKLAWLILGREGSNGGAEAAMLQQAAVALLGGSASGGGLAQSVGLDELGYRSAETNSDGTVRESSISIGKRLSRRLYLSYERSLSGALGTMFVFYDISRRFTLRAQSNEESSAVDLIFTRRYQSLHPDKRAALEAAKAAERSEQIEHDAQRQKSE